MDCIRIFGKLDELKKDPDSPPTLWSPYHLAIINIKDKTVVFDSKPDQILKLVRGETYERPRGETSLKADASNCNIKGKWPKSFGEYAKLWAKTYKKDKLDLDGNAEPSMREVVMGIYLHHMLTVESTFQNLKERNIDIGLYRKNMLKAFNTLLLSLDMGEEDIDKPLT